MKKETILGVLIGVALTCSLGAASMARRVGRFQVGADCMIDTTDGTIYAVRDAKGNWRSVTLRPDNMPADVY